VQQAVYFSGGNDMAITAGSMGADTANLYMTTERTVVATVDYFDEDTCTREITDGFPSTGAMRPTEGQLLPRST
jgi:hypothetical protein